MSSKIVYPVGCKPIDVEQSPEEIISGIEALYSHLRTVKQKDFADDSDSEEKTFGFYKHLFDRLISPDFRNFKEPQVQVLVACCIGELFRILPFDCFLWDDDELKTLYSHLRTVKQKDFADDSDLEEKTLGVYKPLFDRFISPDFLNFKERQVQVLVACCIGELFRILPFDCFRWDDDELKTLYSHLRTVKQKDFADDPDSEEKMLGVYKPLFDRFISPDFLNFKERQVQVLVACCIGELFRILPFDCFLWEDDELMIILKFFIKQLKRFDSSESVIYSYCVCLVKVLNKTEIISKLFVQLHYTTNKEEIYDRFLLAMFAAVCAREDIIAVEVHILRLIVSFINSSKHATNTGIDIILSSILPENREKTPAAYNLAVKVIRNCSGALNYPIKMRLLRLLHQDEPCAKTGISGHEFEVLYALHCICPTLLVGVWNQLETFMLERTDSPRKKTSLTLLAHMFSEKNSDFATKYHRLWLLFKDCCTSGDSSSGRALIVALSPKFLANQPDLRSAIILILKHRACDNEAPIRFGVVKAINAATENSLEILNEGNLLDILKNRSLDKNEIVHKEALNTLGLIYRRITDSCFFSLMMKATWIANTLLHMYKAPYDLNILMPHIDKVIVKCLVPCELRTVERMIKLLQLWCLLDDKSRSNFHWYQELKKRAFASTHKLLAQYREPVEEQPTEEQTSKRTITWRKEMLAGKLSLVMGNQKESHQKLLLLIEELEVNKKLLNFLEEYMKKDNSCEDFEKLWVENVNILTYSSRSKKRSLTAKRRLTTRESVILIVKSLCSKVVSFLVDEESMEVLLDLVIKCVKGEDIVQDLNLDQRIAGRLGVDLLYEYFYVMPHLAFQNKVTLRLLLFLLKVDDYRYCENVLKIFVILSGCKPIGEVFPSFLINELFPLWNTFAVFGSPKQAKLAVICLCEHMTKENKLHISSVLREILNGLDSDSEHYLSRIVALGYFAKHLPNYISRPYIFSIQNKCKEVLHSLIKMDSGESSSDDATWYEKDCLPYELECKVAALKALTRLTITLCERSFTEMAMTFLSKIVDNGGAYRKPNELSTATKAWLRLTAGCSFLKICDVPEIYRQVNRIHFFKMIVIMYDPSKDVRCLFIKKLCKRLMQWEKQRYGLPSIFISYFVVGGLEEDEEVQAYISKALTECVQDKHYQVWSIFCIARLYKSKAELLQRCQPAMPDFCIQVAIQILARYVLRSLTDEISVRRVYVCLSFLLKKLMGTRSTAFIFLATDFYSKLFTTIRCCKNAIMPHDDSLNKKIWAVCEIGEFFLSTLNPIINNNAETAMPDIDETFLTFDPSINNRGVCYLTVNLNRFLITDTLLPMDVIIEEEPWITDESGSDIEEVAVLHPDEGEYERHVHRKEKRGSHHRSSDSFPLSSFTSDGGEPPNARRRLEISKIQSSARKKTGPKIAKKNLSRTSSKKQNRIS